MLDGVELAGPTLTTDWRGGGCARLLRWSSCHCLLNGSGCNDVVRMVSIDGAFGESYGCVAVA